MNLKTIKSPFFLFLSFCILSFTWGFTETVPPSFTVQIPMRDKTELPTDIYLPDLMAENLPCILIRTPAGRDHYKEAFIPLAKAGYVVAIQDTRSHLDPDGKTFPYVSDGWGNLQDGYDTVAWLSKSQLTNGQVGTLGFSAMGITQLLMAPTKPPGLKCQYIGMAAGSLYHHAIYVGGQLLKNQVEGWLGLHARDPSVLSHVVNSPYYNDFWQGLDSQPLASQVEVPAFFYGGWFDTFLQGTLDAFVARQEQGGDGARGRQKLVMGPWTHYWPQSFKMGDFEVPDIAKMPPLDVSPLRWFNHYLKGIDNEVDKIPNVTYFVMGPFDGSSSKGNVWKTADRWPVPSSSTPLYLDSTGKLQYSVPNKKESTLTYTYDPANPVSTIGGHNLFLDSGPKDQRPIESREDVLVFTTEPLKEDLEVTGRLKAKLYIVTNRKDTDIVMRLSDVYPDGRSILISDGICRLCMHKNSVSQPNGKPREIEVDLWSTSMVFAKGHQIRVSITSSNHPRFEKNLNVPVGEKVGDVPLSARNTLYFGKNYPSQIILPIVSSDEKVTISLP